MKEEFAMEFTLPVFSEQGYTLGQAQAAHHVQSITTERPTNCTSLIPLCPGQSPNVLSSNHAV